jgi:protein-tyrosine-phosphatase
MVKSAYMSIDEIAKLATPLAWPVTALLIAALFYKPSHALLKRLAETLTFKSVNVKALGVEAELTPEYARTVLHELLDDITATSNQLTQEEIALFDSILNANGAKTVVDIIPGFARSSVEHQRLRNLRDQKLILPAERGQWEVEKHPVVTPYGHLVAKLRTSGAERVRKFQQNESA